MLLTLQFGYSLMGFYLGMLRKRAIAETPISSGNIAAGVTSWEQNKRFKSIENCGRLSCVIYIFVYLTLMICDDAVSKWTNMDLGICLEINFDNLRFYSMMAWRTTGFKLQKVFPSRQSFHLEEVGKWKWKNTLYFRLINGWFDLHLQIRVEFFVLFPLDVAC